MSAHLRKFLITGNASIAEYADDCGVDVIMVDLEHVGKHERQAGQGTPIYGHTIKDVGSIRKVLKKSKLMTRINPFNEGSRDEIEQVIDSGSDVLMIPIFHRPQDVEKLMNLIRGRLPVNLLFETPASIFRFRNFLDVLKFEEVHFGLNDLRILTGLKFLFETLAGGVLEKPCEILQQNSIPYGIGGVGIANNAVVHPQDILNEYVRHGATRVILSRSLTGGADNAEDLKARVDLRKELKVIDDMYKKALDRSESQVAADSTRFRKQIYEIAEKSP